MCTDFYIPRSGVSSQISKAFLDDHRSNGTTFQFWSSARHTGKSSFFYKELSEDLTAKGCHVVLIDLWGGSERSKSGDPGFILADALSQELQNALKNRPCGVDLIPFSWIALGNLKVETPVAGRRRGGALGEVLQEIAKHVSRDIVVIVDEAQEALETAAGREALAALRRAHDEMNGDDGGHRLFLLFAGSHRDKLSSMVSGRKALFPGAELQEFPRLGRVFVEELVTLVNVRLASTNQLDVDDVDAAFGLLGHRPGILGQVIQEHALGLSGSAGLHQTVTERADALRAKVWHQHQNDYGTLNGVQRAILAVLIEDGSGFSPFAAKTLERIGDRMGDNLTAPKVQKALDGLRDRGIVWRPGRGSYALEDQDMREWLLSTPEQPLSSVG